MKLQHLTQMAFELNRALDMGRGSRVDKQDLKRSIERGDLFRWLPSPAGAHADLNLGVEKFDDKVQTEIIEAFKVLASDRDTMLKLSAAGSGLSLLLAYVIELIETRRWTD